MANKVECWLPVIGWEGIYEVSNKGRVRSLDRVIVDKRGCIRHIRGRMLKPGNSKGYWTVSLCIDGTQVTELVHKLVLRAFVGSPPTGMEGLHGPYGSFDNRWPENLSYGTHSQNMLDTKRDGTCYQQNRTHCPRNHELIAPNLVPSVLKRGSRSCLACQRATTNQRYYQQLNKPFDLKSEADAYYRAIMSGASSPRPRLGDSNKTHCPRNHKLTAPNLVAAKQLQGYRECLACSRARNAGRLYQRTGRPYDTAAKADEYYRKIMGQVTAS